MRKLFNRRRPGHLQLAIGGTLTVLVLVVAIGADALAPANPNEQALLEKLAAPGDGRSLGTDQFGRDLLSRLLVGSQVSLLVAGGAVMLGASVGLVLGMIAGYARRGTDMVIGRLFDIVLSFPAILLALALVAALGPSLQNTMLAIGVTTIPVYGRVVRGSVLTIRGHEFIQASRSAGAGPVRIMLRHVLPNILSPLLVTITVGIATAILVEAALSFVGLGTPPPTATWGAIINDGKAYLDTAPWISTSAGVAIVITVLGLTLLGDGLREALDPKLKR